MGGVVRDGSAGLGLLEWAGSASAVAQLRVVHSVKEIWGLKHKGPPGGASGPFAFKSRLLSRDATGGGSSRPEALNNYDINLRPGSCGLTNFGRVFGLKLWKAKI